MNHNPRRYRLLSALCLLFVAASLAFAQETSVNPGINDSYKDPDPAEFTKRFETESREIFVNRDKIVALCKLNPGMAVADVGAGTGLFTRLFAKEVGSQGKVYAVDIAKNFLKHIEKTTKERGLTNVETILCTPDSANLPRDSVELAFICDVYHHFEFPHKTMQSIHRALRKGGRLVVIDFHRIEGESSDWVLGHVRAGQEVFRAEIEGAGFKLVEEPRFLKENYCMIFEKSDAPKK
jgi:ubiquinone/menaquinone biosynthesis C-methylase UbiE